MWSTSFYVYCYSALVIEIIWGLSFVFLEITLTSFTLNAASITMKYSTLFCLFAGTSVSLFGRGWRCRHMTCLSPPASWLSPSWRQHVPAQAPLQICGRCWLADACSSPPSSTMMCVTSRLAGQCACAVTRCAQWSVYIVTQWQSLRGVRGVSSWHSEEWLRGRVEFPRVRAHQEGASVSEDVLEHSYSSCGP